MELRRREQQKRFFLVSDLGLVDRQQRRQFRLNSFNQPAQYRLDILAVLSLRTLLIHKCSIAQIFCAF